MFLAVLCFHLGFSQNSPLQPQAAIQTLKDLGSTFQIFAPFSYQSQLRTQKYQDICTDCQVYQLDQNSLRRFMSQDARQITLQLPTGSQNDLKLDLYQVDLLSEANFELETSDGQEFTAAQSSGKHYRGVIAGEEGSFVAVSVFKDHIMALIASTERGNLVLAEAEDTPGEYLLYESTEMDKRQPFDCSTEDSYVPYRPEELAPQADLRAASNCVNVFLEIDSDVYQDKGGLQETVDYIVGIFNEVATLYANESVKLQLSKMYVWTGQSPYTASNSYEMLRQFQSTRTTIEGDIGQLISYKASGGIAIVDGLCQSRTEYKLSFASISKSFRQVPTYSYSVMVVAHELGHLLGSQHTHACVWNGNSTAIDGCAGSTEGSCSVPDIPADGGTIMSYCHITSVGINFTKGFGTQPGNIIRNRVNNASCLVACTTDNGGSGGDTGSGGAGDSGACIDVSFELTLDLFGSETSWEIRDAAGTLQASGSGFKNKMLGQKYVTNLCLPEGCYDLIVKDSDGDGMCCDYGQGNFQVVTADGSILAQGGQFTNQITKNFCVSATTDGGGDNGGGDNGDNGGDNGGDDPNAGCPTIDFNQTGLIGFGGSQDQGTYEIIENGKGVKLTGNAWKAIPMDYDVTTETYIRFDYKSENQPEMGVIGFDENLSISANRAMMISGSQNWGIRDYKTYPEDGSWKTYEIRVGKHYKGKMKYLFFGADHDRLPKDGDAFFRNVYVYESTFCGNLPDERPTANTIPKAASIQIFPNPGNEHVFFDVREGTEPLQDGVLTIYNIYGQEVRIIKIKEAGKIKIETQDLAPGTYIYRLKGFESEYTGKFSINR